MKKVEQFFRCNPLAACLPRGLTFSLSPKGKAEMSDPPKSWCLQLSSLQWWQCCLKDQGRALQEALCVSQNCALYLNEGSAGITCLVQVFTGHTEPFQAAVGADVQTQGCAGGAAVLRRRRSLGCSGSCSAVPCASASPSLPRSSFNLLRMGAVPEPSMGLQELQYLLQMNARAGMIGWMHGSHMFWLNLPVAAAGVCHSSGSFHSHGEQWGGTLSTEGLCSHPIAWH